MSISSLLQQFLDLINASQGMEIIENEDDLGYILVRDLPECPDTVDELLSYGR